MEDEHCGETIACDYLEQGREVRRKSTARHTHTEIRQRRTDIHAHIHRDQYTDIHTHKIQIHTEMYEHTRTHAHESERQARS